MKIRYSCLLYSILLLSAIGFACGRINSAQSINPNDKPQKVLLDALRAKQSARSYRFKNTQSDTAGQSISMEAEYLAPDKYHIFANTNMSGKGSGKIEMIVIGQDSFTRMENGEWQKKQLTSEETKREHMKEEMLIKNLTAADESAIKFIGVEDLEGVKNYIYQYVSKPTPEVPTQGETKTWVGTADRLLHKVEMKFQVPIHNNQLGITQITTYSDYNTDIKIVSPVQ